MKVIQVKQGEPIIQRRQRVTDWYIVQEGSARLSYDFVSATLGSNAIVGILERDWFLCDYIAETDMSLIIFPYGDVEDLRSFLSANQKIRRMFLRSAIIQRHNILGIYVQLRQQLRQFQQFVNSTTNEYTNWCEKAGIDLPLNIIQGEPLDMKHKVDSWEIDYSNKLIQIYLDEYLNLMDRDENMTVSAIMEISAQMHRAIQGIGEMVSFFNYHKQQLFSEDRRNLFHNLLDLQRQLHFQGQDASAVEAQIEQLFDISRKFRFLDKTLIAACREEYDTVEQVQASVIPADEEEERDDLLAILEYAAWDLDKIKSTVNLVHSFCEALKRDDDKDEELYQLRKQINEVFYKLYEDCFLVSVKSSEQPPMPVLLFFNFGYMGAEPLGSERVRMLYELLAHMDLCRSDICFTIYDWLKLIYEGQRQTSKNDFDMDFNEFLKDQVKGGYMQKDEAERLKGDATERVKFEIQNMFKSANRMASGRVLQFYPIITKKELFAEARRMLVTAQAVSDALDEIRSIDFGVFYRESFSHGLGAEMAHEVMIYEVLPDVILLPNVGEKSVMWQETASTKNDTPARILLPIFSVVEMKDILLSAVARYRWEICRRVQGVHWNDLHYPSLTSAYSDYLQYYRKNRELSTTAREQIQASLKRAKNNYREVFVKDYITWIRYEAKGSVRLNRVVRGILFTYCPFARALRDEHRESPLLTDVIRKHDLQAKNTRRRLQAVYDKYLLADEHEMTPQMQETMHYYEL